MRGKLGHINRAVAAILALLWACAGIVGLVAAYAYGRWVLGPLPSFHCGMPFFGLTWSLVPVC